MNNEKIVEIQAKIFKLDQDANHWDSKMQDCWDYEDERGAQKCWRKVVKINDKIDVLKAQLKKL
jgi:predicted DNA binding CopG/RHH family protein